jgi:hypothetical protein
MKKVNLSLKQFHLMREVLLGCFLVFSLPGVVTHFWVPTKKPKEIRKIRGGSAQEESEKN